jgi:hypothetical protein
VWCFRLNYNCPRQDIFFSENDVCGHRSLSDHKHVNSDRRQIPGTSNVAMTLYYLSVLVLSVRTGFGKFTFPTFLHKYYRPILRIVESQLERQILKVRRRAFQHPSFHCSILPHSSLIPKTYFTFVPMQLLRTTTINPQPPTQPQSHPQPGPV